jgi:GTP cyclohydrolase II
MAKSEGIRRAAPGRLDFYAEAEIPTKRGDFRLLIFRERRTGIEHLAMVRGDVRGAKGIPVRIHSECLTGEVLGSLKCDCRDQLDGALELIARAGIGVLVYLRQEGRGIGLGNKVRAYALQAKGADTYEANRRLGFADDLRRYDLAAEILKALGVASIDLITNNPQKVDELNAQGIHVRQRIPATAPVNAHNRAYLRAKHRSGHLIDLASLSALKAEKD